VNFRKPDIAEVESEAKTMSKKIVVGDITDALNKARTEIREILNLVDKLPAGDLKKTVKGETQKLLAAVDESANAVDILRAYGRFLRLIKKYPELIRPSKFKTSWDFVDQKLMTRGEAHTQLSLFDDLGNSSEWERLEGNNDLWINELHGRGGEWRLINSLFQIVEDAKGSRSSEAKYGVSTSKYNNIEGLTDKQVHYLRLKKKILYKTYTGKDNPSGQDIKLVNKTLESLEKKYIRVFYQRPKKGKGGKRLYDLIEINEPLIKMARVHKDINEAERSGILNKGEALDKTELVISFNPVLIDQLETRYLLYARDISSRIAEAAGGPNSVTNAMTQLTDYLIRAIHTQREKSPAHFVYTETLINKLGLSKYKRAGRRKLVQDRLLNAIRVTKIIGLHGGVERKAGKDGREGYEFTLNLDY
jgi:hypothetical protein